MASHERRSLTLWEKIGDLGALISTVTHLFLDLPKVWIATRSENWFVKQIFAVAFLRNRGRIAKRHTHLIKLPTTGEAIRTTCQKHGLDVKSTVIRCGKNWPDATVHEIRLDGSGNGDVMLYFHGGGYRNTIVGPGHVPVILDCARAAKCSSVIFLEYTLTPTLQYPGQLVQGVAAVRHLLEERKIDAGSIVLGGDSAGGNLALGILAHVIQPHPEIPALPTSSGEKVQFKAALLISPWVTTVINNTSFITNAHKDYITEPLGQMFIDFWAPRNEIWADFLNSPNAKTFWKDVPAEKVLITIGGFEAFRDDVVDMAGVLKATMGEKLELVVAEGEVHVQCVVDVVLGMRPGRSHGAMLEWCKRL